MKRPRQLAFAALCLYAIVTAETAGAWREGKAEWAADYSLALIVCAWVLADARERGRRLWYDYDSVLFFLWPVVAPIYLFQTRGVRAFIPLLIFIVILAVAYGGAFLLQR